MYDYVITFSHTLNLLKHRIYHKKFIEIPHILKNCSFNILYAAMYGTGNSKVFYKYPKNKKINGLAIYAEDDPLTAKFLMDEYKNYCDVHTLKFGGHVAFYNFDGSREHEKIILRKLNHILNNSN
jgi:predicted alpha/beta-fold hydrolase